LTPGKSLVFFYTNHGDPLIEEPTVGFHKLLIGVARIKEIGNQLYFGSKEDSKERYPVWPRRITIDPRQLVRLPYQEYLQKRLDPSKIICRVPDSVSEQFSYVSEHLTDDQAVIVLERLIQSVKAVQKENKIPGNWTSHIKWLDNVLAEVWRNRGVYPGVGSVLAYLGFQGATIYQREILRKLSDKGKDVRDHVISILERRRKPEKEYLRDFETARNKWRDLPKTRKELLKTLCLFDLTEEQVNRVANSSLRMKSWIKAEEKDIIKNPYLLCEQDQGGKNSSPIQFEQIDHGMIPLPDIAKKWGNRVPIPRDDKRRVRALLVAVLSAAAQEGDTLLSLEEALTRVQELLPEERACHPDPELIKANSDFYLKALDFDPEAKHPFVALRRFRNMEIEVAERIQELGTKVWVEGDFTGYVNDFTEYARIVAKARAEWIEVNGDLVSRAEYSPPKNALYWMQVRENGIRGVLWIPAEVSRSKDKKKEREATIKLYVNDLFVKDLSTDYYIFGEINYDALTVVTSRDDVLNDENYVSFQTKLLDVIETKFYRDIASNPTLVNDARIKNDILRAVSKRGDKALIENMVFETTSGEKITGKQILSQEKIFVVSETNPDDMAIGDTFHRLEAGVSVVAPVGLKRILSTTIGTVGRDEVSEIVAKLTRGENATPEEVRQYEGVGKLVNILSGHKVEFRKKMAAEAMHEPGKIIINIESPDIREAKRLLDEGRKDLAMVRLIAVVAHEMAHEFSSVHDVGFYKNFEEIVSQLETKIIDKLSKSKPV